MNTDSIRPKMFFDTAKANLIVLSKTLSLTKRLIAGIKSRDAQFATSFLQK
jgi:hypothetical protein